MRFVDRCTAMRLVVVTVALALTIGCAFRTRRMEYYFGPVFHRSIVPCGRGTEVSQILAVGGLAEVGRQSGISVGLVDRVAVLPREAATLGGCGDDRDEALLGVPSEASPGHWAFSPLYLRVRGSGDVGLVHRTLYGAQAIAGPEATALSLGGVSTTLVRPPADAFSAVRFDASHPMKARFTVWEVRADSSVPENEILEEATP